MERINQFEFYDLGRALKELAGVRGEVPPGEVFFPLIEAQRQLALVLTGRPMPLGLSKGPAESLFNFVDELVGLHLVVRDADGAALRYPEPSAPPIPAWRWGAYQQLLTAFETVFAEEMRAAATYHVPRRGIFYTPALVDSADETFPVDLRPFIPGKTKEDWRAAGRCLAFNILSASGFHVARAVEGTLESYYQLFSGKPGATCRSWHDYHKELAAIRTANLMPCPSEKTLAELDQMRADYRNPIMHPRVVLSEADARMLFANGETLIIAMAQEIRGAQAGIQPALGLIQGGAVTAP